MSNQLPFEWQKPLPKWAWGCSLLFFLWAAALLISSSFDLGESEMNAWLQSQDFVSARLKAPATAIFPHYDKERVQSLGNHRYKVDGFVDAENSFSAHIRTYWNCTLRYRGRNQWELVDIHIDNLN